MSDWTPVHHEAIPEPPPQPEPKAGSRDTQREARPPDRGMSVGLALNVPPDLMDRMGEIADAQAGMIARLGQSSDSLEQAVAALVETHAAFSQLTMALTEGQQEIVEQLAAQSADADARAAEARAMFEASKKQGDALMAFLTNTTKLIGQVEKAIVAPRKVTLKRDENGLAREAISRVQG